MTMDIENIINEIELAWIEEAERRIELYRKGESETLSKEEVFRRIFSMEE